MRQYSDDKQTEHDHTTRGIYVDLWIGIKIKYEEKLNIKTVNFIVSSY